VRIESKHAGIEIFLAAILFLAIAAAAQKKPPAKPLDLNTATLEQLEQLPGTGPTTAKAIIDFREKAGPFQRVEDLRAIHGISKSRLEKLRPYVTVNPPPKNLSSRSAPQRGTCC
jgi:competence ComEA-like helix-hairpin-helix protein